MGELPEPPQEQGSLASLPVAGEHRRAVGPWRSSLGAKPRPQGVVAGTLSLGRATGFLRACRPQTQHRPELLAHQTLDASDPEPRVQPRVARPLVSAGGRAAGKPEPSGSRSRRRPHGHVHGAHARTGCWCEVTVQTEERRLPYMRGIKPREQGGGKKRRPRTHAANRRCSRGPASRDSVRGGANAATHRPLGPGVR